ncbi:MAG: hypothetical protein K0S47_3803, partial [Herbinix sp.]|nr:hypothetical protein [Herbinix sp.]
ELVVEDTEDYILKVHRISGTYEAVLTADLKTYQYTISYRNPESGEWCEL